jgi:hypothetical protein
MEAPQVSGKSVEYEHCQSERIIILPFLAFLIDLSMRSWGMYKEGRNDEKIGLHHG